MPAPSLQQLATKVNEIYAAMEYQRPGSQVSGTLSSAASYVSFGYVKPKIMSVKTPKFQALVSATTDEEITAALAKLRADAEVKEHSAIKNIIDIYEHAFKASKGLYADNTAQEIREQATPTEAAEEAIDGLTNSYNEHFTLVANKAEFLQMTTQFLRAQLRIEKQQAVDAARAEEKLKKHLELANTKANALLAQKLAVHATNKTASLAKETALDAQHTHAIAEVEALKAQHQLQLEAAKTDAEHEQNRIYTLAISAQEETHQEAASHKKTATALTLLQAEREKLTENVNSAHGEITRAHDTIETQQNLIANLDKHLRAAETSVTANAKNLETVKREIASLEIKQFNANRQHAHAEAIAEERTIQLQNSVTTLQGSLGLTKEELRSTRVMRDKLALEVKQLSETGREKNLALHDAKHQIEILAVQLREQETATTMLEQELTTANESLADYRVRISKELKASKQLRNENESLQHENSNLSAAKQSLESELVLQQSIIALQQEMQQEHEDAYNNTDFVKEIRAEQAVSAHLKEAFGKAEAHISHLESEQNSLKGTLKPLVEQNSQLRRQVNELTAQVEKMRLAASANAHFARLSQQQQHSQKQQNNNNPKHHYNRPGKQ